MLGRSSVPPQHISPVHIMKHKVGHTAESSRNGIFIGIISTMQINPTPLHRFSQTGIAHPVVVFAIAVIQAGLEHTIRPFVHTHHAGLQTHNFTCNRTTIFHLGSAGIGTFGSYQNHTTCRFCTINGSRSIFQEVNGFDVIGIELSYLTHTTGRYTVNNQERFYLVLRYRTTDWDTPSLFTGSSRRAGDA